jgi:hypothetical protein
MAHYRSYALNDTGRITPGSDAWFDADSTACAFVFTGLERGDKREAWRDTKCVGFYIGSCIVTSPAALPKLSTAVMAPRFVRTVSRSYGLAPQQELVGVSE